MGFAIRLFFRELFYLLYAKIFGYYKSIDYLPIYNWFKLIEGDYSYLYMRRIKNYPYSFADLYGEMFFQLEKVDITRFEKMHKVAYLRSLYATTKRIQYYNSANFLEAEILAEKKKGKAQKGSSLNDMLNFIEQVLSMLGQIKVHDMSTSRFFSLYNLAVDKNRKHGNS